MKITLGQIPLKSILLFCKTPLTPGNYLWLNVTQNIQTRPHIPLAASAEAGLGNAGGPCACCRRPRLSKAPELSHSPTLVG